MNINVGSVFQYNISRDEFIKAGKGNYFLSSKLFEARERKREKKRKNARIKENDNFFWIVIERNEEVIDGSSGRKIIFRISVVVR